MSDPLPDDIDWSLTTFEGNRRRQHEEFRALSFREKLAALEDMDEVVAFFGGRKNVEGGAVGSEGDSDRDKTRPA